MLLGDAGAFAEAVLALNVSQLSRRAAVLRQLSVCCTADQIGGAPPAADRLGILVLVVFYKAKAIGRDHGHGGALIPDNGCSSQG
jgi:hypothetical protein